MKDETGAAEARASRAAVPAGGNGGGAAACGSGLPLTLHARRCADARGRMLEGSGLLRLPGGYARRRCTTPECRAGGSRSGERGRHDAGEPANPRLAARAGRARPRALCATQAGDRTPEAATLAAGRNAEAKPLPRVRAGAAWMQDVQRQGPPVYGCAAAARRGAVLGRSKVREFESSEVGRSVYLAWLWPLACHGARHSGQAGLEKGVIALVCECISWCGLCRLSRGKALRAGRTSAGWWSRRWLCLSRCWSCRLSRGKALRAGRTSAGL